MTFNTAVDSSRQALSGSAKVEQKIRILRFYLIWKILTFLQIRPISNFFTGSDSPDRTDHKNV